MPSSAANGAPRNAPRQPHGTGRAPRAGEGQGRAFEPSPIFHKTSLCKFFAVGACSRGSRCKFAHGSTDLVQAPDFTKTQYCPSVLSGARCEAGRRCTFAHSPGELRPWADGDGRRAGGAAAPSGALAAAAAAAPVTRRGLVLQDLRAQGPPGEAGEAARSSKAPGVRAPPGPPVGNGPPPSSSGGPAAPAPGPQDALPGVRIELVEILRHRMDQQRAYSEARGSEGCAHSRQATTERGGPSGQATAEGGGVASSAQSGPATLGGRSGSQWSASGASSSGAGGATGGRGNSSSGERRGGSPDAEDGPGRVAWSRQHTTGGRASRQVKNTFMDCMSSSSSSDGEAVLPLRRAQSSPTLTLALQSSPTSMCDAL